MKEQNNAFSTQSRSARRWKLSPMVWNQRNQVDCAGILESLKMLCSHKNIPETPGFTIGMIKKTLATELHSYLLSKVPYED